MSNKSKVKTGSIHLLKVKVGGMIIAFAKKGTYRRPLDKASYRVRYVPHPISDSPSAMAWRLTVKKHPLYVSEEYLDRVSSDYYEIVPLLDDLSLKE